MLFYIQRRSTAIIRPEYTKVCAHIFIFNAEENRYVHPTSHKVGYHYEILGRQGGALDNQFYRLSFMKQSGCFPTRDYEPVQQDVHQDMATFCDGRFRSLHSWFWKIKWKEAYQTTVSLCILRKNFLGVICCCGKVFTEPLPSNGRIIWLNYCGFQASCHNALRVVWCGVCCAAFVSKTQYVRVVKAKEAISYSNALTSCV